MYHAAPRSAISTLEYVTELHVVLSCSCVSFCYFDVLRTCAIRYCTQLFSQMHTNVHLDCHLWIYFAHIAFGHASLASCILDRTPAQAIITASHPRTQLSLTSPPQTQTHRTSALSSNEQDYEPYTSHQSTTLLITHTISYPITPSI
jgi:hypothetical protein